LQEFLQQAELAELVERQRRQSIQAQQLLVALEEQAAPVLLPMLEGSSETIQIRLSMPTLLVMLLLLHRQAQPAERLALRGVVLPEGQVMWAQSVQLVAQAVRALQRMAAD
jgi:hypothetical protein